MELAIFEHGKEIGSLQLEKTGLYQTVTAHCLPESREIARLYVWQGMQGSCLGVLCPEGTTFTLQKRVSRAALPFVPETAVIGCEEDGFRPWRGEFDGAQIPDGYLRLEGETATLAVPYAEQMEYPFVHRLTEAESRTICQRRCIVLQEASEPEAVPDDALPTPMPEPLHPDGTEQEEAPADEPQTRYHTEL